jgi:hypothetical protein
MTATGKTAFYAVLLLTGAVLIGCEVPPKSAMTVTAYSDDKISCSWERGSWKYLKLDFWNRYVSAGPDKGRKYTGLTASGTKPRQYHPGLFSMDSLKKPWMIPVRIILAPWLLLERPGTIAADTTHHPFGTTMRIPGYGLGVVEDRGGAINGPDRIDLFYATRRRALDWGRRKVDVTVLEK